MEDYLNVNENFKYEVIKQVVDEKKSKQRAECELGLSRRQINRYIQRFLSEGRIGFKHKNKGRKCSFAISNELKQQIISLYIHKYNGFNFVHFHEFLSSHEEISISLSSLRNILAQANCLSPKARKATRRKLKKKIAVEKKNLNDPLTSSLSSTEVETVPLEKAHPSRSRKKYAGELLQMDASPFVWFGEETSHLHIAIDDSTGMIVGAYFDQQETLKGYYEVTAQFLQNYGIPFEILTDRRSVFIINRNKNKDSSYDEGTLTQYGYMCKTLGISLDTTSIPQGKGRVERAFNTLQSRLANELHLYNIQTFEEANHYLLSFVENFNKQFAYTLKDTQNAFENLDTTLSINQLLSRHTFRIVSSGHSIHYKNHSYRFIDSNGQQVYLPNKTKVMVIETRDEHLFASLNDTLYSLELIEEHEKVSKEFDLESIQQPENKDRKPYIPPMSHPWKATSYQYYLSKLKNKS